MKKFLHRSLIFSSAIFYYCLSITQVSAATQTSGAYVVTGGPPTDNIYLVNLSTGNATLVTPTPIGGVNADLNGLALSNNTTAYVASFAQSNIYKIDLTTGSSSLVTATSVGSPGSPNLTDIALGNSTTGYAGGLTDNNLYRIDLTTGNSSLVNTSPIGTNPGLVGVAVVDNAIAYVAGINDNNIYKIDLSTGTPSLVTGTPVGSNPGLAGLALTDTASAYVAGSDDSNLYFVNLTTGASTLITPTPVGVPPAGLWAVSLANNTTAYVTGLDSNVYLIDLTTGQYSLVTSMPVGVGAPGLYGIDLIPQILTTGLKGNNRKFAKYLNEYAPFEVTSLIFLQSDVAAVLQKAIPTRNAIFTYASQTTQIALGQLAYDHLVQNRWRRRETPTSQMTASLTSDEYLASGKLMAPKKSAPPPQTPKNTSFFSPWVGAFGEYAREKSQHQTPAFSTGAGGVIAAVDYNAGVQPYAVGGGVAYAHTHIHEEKGLGHANVDQGYLLAYGTFVRSHWYADWGLWGGYYSVHNVRVIDFTGFPSFSGKATLKTHGWQFAPHLETGYAVYKEGWLGVEPFVMADWVNCWERGAREHGAAPLDMGQKGRYCSLVRGETGLRLKEMLTYSWGNITFTEKTSYAYQKAFHTGTLTAFLVGSPGSFDVTTLIGAQNMGVGEFEVLFTPVKRRYPYASLSYQGEFGSRYQSHRGLVMIGLDI